MGRPQKQTADWFPHYVVGSRKTIFVLESRWGNDGYAFWFKLIELLCQSDGHFYDCSNQSDMDYLTAISNIDEKTVMDIMTMLSDRGNIDKDLWENHKIIWCQSLVDNLSLLYSKRKVSAPVKPIIGEFPNRELSDNELYDNGNPHITLHNSTEDIKTEETPSLSPPRGEPPKTAPTPDNKKTYGKEFALVKLADDEYGKLVQRLGKDSAADYIERLDGWLAEGHRKRNHYATILNWWRKDHPLESSEKGENSDAKFKPSRSG